MCRIDAIIFDMDGTVLNLGTMDMEHVRNDLNRLFKKYGINEYFKPILQKITYSLQVLREKGLSEKQTQKISDTAYKILDEFEEKAALQARAVEGAHELLQKLGKYKLGLISSNGKKCVSMALKTTSLEKVPFLAIITRDDVKQSKPNPTPLISAIKKIGSKHTPIRHVVYVGNHIYDMICGKEAEKKLKNVKVTTIGIRSKSFDPKSLETSKETDFFINSLSNLNSILFSLSP